MNINDLNTQRQIRSNVLETLKKGQKIPQQVFRSYIKSSFISSVENDKIIVACETETGADLLKNFFKDQFLYAIQQVTNTNFDVVFVALTDLRNKSKEEIIKSASPVFFKTAFIDDNFTFDRFIEGPSNKEAKKAALTVASNLGIMYNPLYIQGDSGLGKTHLLHGIAHFIKDNYPNKKILCISAQNFFDEYIQFAKNPNQDNDLTEYIKSFDVFLIDDIQQLKNKEKTQDFFFDIYTYFINNNKQIVLTSDKLQNSLEGIPNRLITRFLQGLTVTIRQPDFSTCKQILLKKIEFSQVNGEKFSEDAIDFIAKNYSSSIRQLEGILTRITFYSTLNDIQGEITLQIVSDALGIKNLKIDKTNKTDANKIISVVADYYSVSNEQIKGKGRKAQITLARHIAIYLIRELLDIPYVEIGALFSNRDHSTIIYSIENVSNMLKTDKELEGVITKLKSKLE